MRNTRRIFIVFGLAIAFLGAFPLTSHAAEILDGKVFVTFLDGEDDVLTFEDGTFHSSSCDEWGFGKGRYTTAAEGESITFKAETTSAKEGSLVWTGSVLGDTIEGSYLWTKKGWFRTKTKTKNFTGTLQK